MEESIKLSTGDSQKKQRSKRIGINYKNGRIYKIQSSKTKDVFIDSTTQDLSRRMSKLKSNYIIYKDTGNRPSDAYEILKHDDAKILLIEMCPCGSIDELNKRLHEIKEKTKNCINK